MQSGQVSIELFIIILVLITGLATLGTIADQTIQTNDAILLEHESRALANETIQRLNSLSVLTKTLKTGEIARIPTRRFIFPPSHNHGNCRILLDVSQKMLSIELEYTLDTTPDYVLQRPFQPVTEFTYPVTTPCGEKISIQR